MSTLEKIQKVMRVFMTLAKIGMVLAYVAAALLLAGAGSLAAGDLVDKVPLLGTFADTAGVNGSQAIWLLIATAVSALFGAVLLTLLYRYFRAEVADGTPFTVTGAEKVKRLGISAMVLSFVSMCLTDAIYERIGLSAFNNFDNAGGITLGIGLILFSLVLKYGAELESKA